MGRLFISFAKRMSTATSPSVDIGEDINSPTDSVIGRDFQELSAEEQERQREEWKAELKKTEEEILTLKQVLTAKERHAAGLKRRLGITAWREFSEDMTQGLKNLQESAAYKKTGEAITAAKAKSASVWSSISNSQSFISASTKMGSAFGAAKSKVTASFSSQNLSAEAGGGVHDEKTTNGSDATNKDSSIPEEK